MPIAPLRGAIEQMRTALVVLTKLPAQPTATLSRQLESDALRRAPHLLVSCDTAHGIVPFHGQGMNCAFEDCSEFNRCLDNASDWEELFQAVDKTRRPNAEAIPDMSLENYIEMRDSVRYPIFHLHKEIEWLLEKRHPDRFVARYSMVMFHRIPYAEVQKRGKIQAAILEQLSADAEELDDVDIALADRLVKEKLSPIQGLRS